MTGRTSTRRWLVAMVVAAGLAPLIASCSDSGDSGGGSDCGADRCRTIGAANGDVSIPEHPERIVVLWQPTLAAVVGLGFDPVGAVGEPDRPRGGENPYLPEDYPTDDITILPQGGDLSVEAITNLEPDLILGADVGALEDLEPLLSGFAPTVLVPWSGTGSWRRHLTDVAEVLGVPDRAQDVVDAYQSRIAEVGAEVAEVADGKEVSVIRVQSPDALRFETPESFPGQVLDDLGLTRPESQLKADDDRDYIEVSPERLADGDGDVLFVLPNAEHGGALDQLQSNPLWGSLRAVQNHQVFTGNYAYWGSSNYFGANHIINDVEKAFTSQ